MSSALAYLRRWFHCLIHLHRGETIRTFAPNGWRHLTIGCECGKVFYCDEPGLIE